MAIPRRLKLNAWSRGSAGSAGAVDKEAPGWAVRARLPHVPRFMFPGAPPDLRDWRHPLIGWGLVAADDDRVPPADRATGADLPEPLHELLLSRRGSPILRYRVGDPHEATTLRRYAAGGPTRRLDIAATEFGIGDNQIPKYLLIWGGPAEIPWDLQFALNARFAVGRLHLPPAGLEHYVEALLNDWGGTEPTADPLRSLIWATDHGDADMSHLMKSVIASPLHKAIGADPDLAAGAIFLPGQRGGATGAALARSLAEHKPGLIVTTSHGVTGPANDLVTLAQQLGLPVDEGFKPVLPDRLLRDWEPGGAIWYAHACASAGSSGETVFDGLFEAGSETEQLLAAVASLGPIIAPLPQALLGRRNPLRAFIGHVEPTFDWTISSPTTGQPLADGIRAALYNRLYSHPQPHPVGLALQEVFEPIGTLSQAQVQLGRSYNRGTNVGEQLLATQLAARDRASTVILGDPTVTLRLAGPSDEAPTLRPTKRRTGEMAKTRIVAQFMHETERDAALPLMGEPIVSGKIVIGEVEERDIERLEGYGLLVSRVDESIAPAEGRAGLAPKALPARRGPRAASAPALPVPTPQRTDVYVLEIRGPLLESWRTQLNAAGAEFLEYLQANRFLVRLRLEKLPKVSSMPFVGSARLYSTRDTIDAEHLAARRSGPMAAAGEMVTFELLVHRPQDLKKVRKWLETKRVPIAIAVGRKVRFFALRSSPVLPQIARLPEVSAVDEYVPPRLSNDRARRLVGIDRGAKPSLAQTGKGQVVAVADTGLDKDHPDFKGRIAGLVARGRPGDPSDPHGHGTHVAGSIAGDGTASNGTVRGTAPGAKLFFQSIMDAGKQLTGLDPSLEDVFDEAYRAGARIHSNSWGAAAASAYRVSSVEVDEYVYAHPDMLIVMAAGNAGIAANALNSKPGFVDLLSLDAPATAKNALTVGASRNDRKLNPSPTWGEWWPGEFPDDPIASQAISGDPESLAAFSGRGPCDEAVRIKPDLVGPGTFILSTRSRLAPTEEFWVPPAPDDKYAYMGGTSMATPIVAGCAALVREYYTEARKHKPSAALVKATLVNGARWLKGADSTATNLVAPNVDQGFGRVHLPWTIPSDEEPNVQLLYADEWSTDKQALAFAGDAFQFTFEATGKGRLRLCLVWSDPPGRGIQNSLVLSLEHLPSSKKWSGNQDRVAQLRGPDLGNNVQVVRVDSPAPGQYLAQITARNILLRKKPEWGPQRFALVVSGGVKIPAGSGGGLGVLHG